MSKYVPRLQNITADEKSLIWFIYQRNNVMFRNITTYSQKDNFLKYFYCLQNSFLNSKFNLIYQFSQFLYWYLLLNSYIFIQNSEWHSKRKR